jgi:hypothetical protein
MAIRGLIPLIVGGGAAYFAYNEWNKKGGPTPQENPHGIDPEDLKSDLFEGIDPEDLDLREESDE